MEEYSPVVENLFLFGFQSSLRNQRNLRGTSSTFYSNYGCHYSADDRMVVGNYSNSSYNNYSAYGDTGYSCGVL